MITFRWESQFYITDWSFCAMRVKKTRFFAKSVRSGLFTTVVAQFFCFVFFGWYLLCWCHRVISLTSSFNSWSQFWYAWFVVSESKRSNEKMKGEEARELKGSLTFTTRSLPHRFLVWPVFSFRSALPLTLQTTKKKHAAKNRLLCRL